MLLQTKTWGIVKAALASRVSFALGSPGEELDQHQGLAQLGLDSLLAVEVRSWLLKVLEVDVPVLRLLGLRPWDTDKDHDWVPTTSAPGLPHGVWPS